MCGISIAQFSAKAELVNWAEHLKISFDQIDASVMCSNHFSDAVRDSPHAQQVPLEWLDLGELVNRGVPQERVHDISVEHLYWVRLAPKASFHCITLRAWLAQHALCHC